MYNLARGMAIHFETLTISKPSYLGAGSWELKNLSDITVIFGKNGAGKSVLLRNLRDQDVDSHHYASPERAGEITFNASYMQEELSSGTRAGKRNRNLSPTYRDEVIARIQAYLAKRGNQRTENICHSPEEIEEMLHFLMPDFTFKIKDGNPPFLLTRSLTGQGVSSVNELSSGESEVLALALDLLLICAIWKLEGRVDGILLVDEPDSHLHPDLQQHLARFLVELVNRYGVQMFISTHSTTLLSALGYHGQDNTSVIYLNNSDQIYVAMKFDKTLKELATCLGGHALMGPLFGAPLLLVEGDDDYRVWSQVPRHGHIKLAVIPCNGDELNSYQRSLEKILSSLLPDSITVPSGYVLKDGDKRCLNSGFSHIKGVKLSCHECENLYLSDEILAQLGMDWETAKKRIKTEAHRFGNKQSFLSAADQWDRKSEDIKSVIHELSQILDDRGVHWTLRVGKCLGETARPMGQIADFLGEPVITSFWGTPQTISTTTEPDVANEDDQINNIPVV